MVAERLDWVALEVIRVDVRVWLCEPCSIIHLKIIVASHEYSQSSCVTHKRTSSALLAVYTDERSRNTGVERENAFYQFSLLRMKQFRNLSHRTWPICKRKFIVHWISSCSRSRQLFIFENVSSLIQLASAKIENSHGRPP